MDNDENVRGSSKIATELYFWAQALVFMLILLVGVNTFFLRLSGVDGTSMVPTLHHHDQIVMQVIGYDEPKRDDIVVVVTPAFEDEPLVKRVIGIGGDIIDIDSGTGNVTRNGEVLYEPYIAERIIKVGNQRYPLTVPQGQIFVMGDNRNKSTDSRTAEVGTLEVKNVVGHVVFRLWPLSAIGKVS